jgi:hypothetical protein
MISLASYYSTFAKVARKIMAGRFVLVDTATHHY